MAWAEDMTFLMSLRLMEIFPPGTKLRASIMGALTSSTVEPASPPRMA